MSTLEVLIKKAEKLPDYLLKEVVGFIDYLNTCAQNSAISAEESWSKASMTNALRGFESDPVWYSVSDIKK